MLTKIKTATLAGVAGSVVSVETDIRRGLPVFMVVGLADMTIKEACRRIRPAIMNSGYDFPNERVTVNLAPAGKPRGRQSFRPADSCGDNSVRDRAGRNRYQ